MPLLRAIGSILLPALLLSCGARTGLRTPIVDRLAFVGAGATARGELAYTRTDSPELGERTIFEAPNPHDDSWPAWNPRGDSLAFSRWTAGDATIQVVGLTRPPGGPRRVVCHREASRLDKQISWGWNGILAYHEGGAIWTIAASAPAGTAPVRITPAGITAQHPSWSRDGRLVFAGRVAGLPATLHVVERDGSIRSLGVTGEEPNWSDSRDAIVFSRGGNVIHLEVSSGVERVVAVGGRTPVFGPGSREIAFVREGRIWICDRFGDHQRPVTAGPQDRHPTWRRQEF
jgi:hypothetical protein